MEAAVVRPTPIGFHLFSTIPTLLSCKFEFIYIFETLIDTIIVLKVQSLRLKR